MPVEDLKETVKDYDLILKCWSPKAIIYDPIKAGSIDGTDVVPHDRAISRAADAVYRPNSKVKGRPEATIFVGRLSELTTARDLQEVFSQYGAIKRCRLVEDIVTGRSKCYGFIEYEDDSCAAAAYRRGNRTNIDGRDVFVDMECERLLPGWVPRRMGGGFSGRKESGQLRFGCRDRVFRKPISLLNKTTIMHLMEEKQGRQMPGKLLELNSSIVDNKR